MTQPIALSQSYGVGDMSTSIYSALLRAISSVTLTSTISSLITFKFV